MSLIGLIIYLVCFAIQIGFWLILFRRLATYQQKNPSDEILGPVSVVICAQNEAENLQHHLPAILNHRKANHEVVVVDDHSSDDTAQVLSQFQQEYDYLKVISLEDGQHANRPGKKMALHTGIQAATNDLILVTDADCKPSSCHWIHSMLFALKFNQAEAVLGYGPYSKQPGTLNRWLRYEAVMTAIQYFSWALVGRPYMGVGRNMAYHKDLFQLENLHADMASGDDDLFIQSLSNHNIAIQLHPESFVYSNPPKSWRRYFRMKSRHMTTSFHYTLFFQFWLSLFAASHLGFWILFFMLIGSFPISVIFALLIKWTVQGLLFRPITNRLNEQDLFKHFWWLDIGLAIYYVVMIPGMILRDRKKW